MIRVNNVYGEYMSKFIKIRDDSESRANQLVRYLKNHTDVDVLYLYDVLNVNKNNGFLLYYKDDLHWTDYGAYIGYAEIINNISKKCASIKPIGCVISTGDNDYSIVNGEKCIHIVSEVFLRKYNFFEKVEECFHENPNKTLNSTIFRDSFTCALMQYFNNTFHYVKYYWRYDITEDDLIEMSKNNTDVIILEILETFLPALMLTFPDGV